MNIKTKVLMVMITIISMCGLSACDKKEAQDLIVSDEDGYDVSTDVSHENKICVYIVGEVINPGVYMFDEEVRVNDVVQSAGGFTENAAKEYINLAKKVVDGEQIIIYSIEEIESSLMSQNSGGKLVNINTANKELLMTLPGIGESRAKDIINYREKNGSYSSIEDIMKVSGIKEAAFDKIKELITVN
ncbi:MAG: helix-hairpin-helix domain-containing protein [Lachnospiraceae bacterium]|nr:helix-hairpin-helix domain-containing protein [Lachnospiraceae bacterium]